MFGEEFIKKSSSLNYLETIEEVVKSDRYLTIDDLKVEPVSFKNGIYDITR